MDGGCRRRIRKRIKIKRYCEEEDWGGLSLTPGFKIYEINILNTTLYVKKVTLIHKLILGRKGMC